MELATRLKTEFPDGVRERGDNFFEKDCVRIIDERDDYIAALVDDANDEAYFAQIDFSDIKTGSVGCSCECPSFKNGPCKHIWATLRSLEQHHHFSKLSGTEDLELHAEEPDVLGAGVDPDPTPTATSSDTNGASKEEPVANSPQSTGYSNGNYRRFGSGTPRPKPKAPEPPAGWRDQLQNLQDGLPTYDSATTGPDEYTVQDKQHWFAINLADQVRGGPLALTIFQTVRKKNGEWGKPLLRTINQSEIATLADPVERRIFALLRPIENTNYAGSYYSGNTTFSIPSELVKDAIGLLIESERFVWTKNSDRTLTHYSPVKWDDQSEWQLVLHMLPAPDEPLDDVNAYYLKGRLWRGEEKRGMDLITLATSDGMMLIDSTLTRLRASDSAWIGHLGRGNQMIVQLKELNEFIDELTRLPGLPHIEFAEELEVESIVGQPIGRLQVQRDSFAGPKQLVVDISFRYSDQETTLSNARRGFWDVKERKLVLRNMDAERALLKRLNEFPLQMATHHQYTPGQMTIHTKWLPQLVNKLSDEGWSIIAHGKRMRPASAFHIQVSSGEDWFDLDARVEFDGMTTTLPALLVALNKQRSYVVLDDGSHGVLPEEWLQKYERIAGLGETADDKIRFSASQALLLDALLAEQENVEFDDGFRDAIEQLHSFDGIKPQQEPETFQGTLREYQRDGLGWMSFLRDFKWDGCLADDMGLGKTIQVLAMLQHRKLSRDEEPDRPRTSLVVVPKSLVFNWQDEALRFTPELSVLDYTGTDRALRFSQIPEHDVVVTTYGTLRRDIAKFQELEFDYAILDESQAIKNATSQAFKACRLLKSRHRLAMTGTPIENHLGELWSLFEFLNPGMLGPARSFRQIASQDSAESLDWLGRALKPFILRRTKEQVLTELPAKTEQTLYCEMTPKQGKLYRELRDYYRAQVNDKVEEVGVGRAKIHVLEALLRLRQAACDPRLLDKGEGIPGAKLELLVTQLEEVLSEGHKALVFSQFTSLLALVRADVEEKGWNYEYLDGRTRKRAECVKRFQEDEECQLFLISLKAGGHGLNLTAADYVFILDPWWNPAVEAQAIDRAHRIGQTRSVTAYRLISQDTVEDKIVKLQKSKRELADAIITADKSLLSSMSIEDLQLLFG